MKNLRLLLFIVVAAAFIGQGCEKWRDNRDPQTALDNALAESSFFDVFRIVLAEGKEYEGIPSDVDSCSVRTVVSTSGTAAILKITYSDSGCTSNYNFTRLGVINVEISEPLGNEDAQATATFENFFIKGYQVEGTVIITNKGTADDKTKFRVAVTGGKITSSTGKIVSFTCDYTFTRTEGQSSAEFVWDDVFSVEGESAGINADGQNFKTVAKEPLKFDMTCRWVNKGKTEIEPEGLKTISVNYGEGNCDNDIEAEIGKKSFGPKLK
jgi:hypothetical protein